MEQALTKPSPRTLAQALREVGRQLNAKRADTLSTIRHLADGTTTMSLYDGPPASEADVVTAVTRLAAVFPAPHPQFYNLLAERIIASRMKAEQLRDAVNNLIDNHPYREFRIAELLSHDKNLRLYTYREVCTLVTKGEADFSEFRVEVIDGVPYRIKLSELAQKTGHPIHARL